MAGSRKKPLVDEIMEEVEEVLSKRDALTRLEDPQDKPRIIPELERLLEQPSVFESPTSGNGADTEIPSFETRAEGENLIQVVHQLLEGGSE